jgi:hypothetical protein
MVNSQQYEINIPFGFELCGIKKFYSLLLSVPLAGLVIFLNEDLSGSETLMMTVI